MSYHDREYPSFDIPYNKVSISYCSPCENVMTIFYLSYIPMIVHIYHTCHEQATLFHKAFGNSLELLASNLNCFEFDGFLQNLSYINDLLSTS